MGAAWARHAMCELAFSQCLHPSSSVNAMRKIYQMSLQVYEVCVYKLTVGN